MSHRTRLTTLFAVLLVAAGGYVYLNSPLQSRGAAATTGIAIDKSASLSLDEETKAVIRSYIADVKLDPKEDNLGAAIRLDHDVGRQQVSQGKIKDAYRTYQKVLAISYRQGSLMGVGIGLGALATAAERADQMDDAVYLTLLMYKVAQTMKNPEEIGVAELALAQRLEREDPSVARMWLLRARDSLKNTRYKEDYIRFLVRLPSDLCCTGDRKTGLKPHGEAWEMAQSLGDAPTHKWTKWEAGLVYADDLIEQKRADEAAAVLQKTLGFFSPAEKSSESYTDVLHRIGRVYAAQRKDEEAKRYFLAAYANYELSRASAPGDEGRARLDLHHQRFINDFVDLYIQSKDYAAALALLESNKARTLNDLIETPSQQQAYGRWNEMEARQAREMNELFQRDEGELLPVRAMEVFSKAAALVKNQEEERRKLQSELSLKDITATRSLSKQQVRNLQRRLPGDVAALSFFVRSDKMAVFVVTTQGIRYIPIELDATELRHIVEPLRLALTNPNNDFYREPAKALFAKLLAPALKTLPPAVKVVLYSPDGILSRIPLAALMDGDRFAGERYAFYNVSSLRYAASADAARMSPAATGISCVDPQIQNARLPFQQEAGQGLKKLYGEKMTLLAAAACSESKLAAAIQQAQAPSFLHIGAHGNFYPDQAMDSAVYLTAEDGDKGGARVWNAKAMAALDMNRLELVTLSSCESGLKDPKRARDVFGIARALFFAGAKQVIAPLWSVEDQSSAEFMQAFYAAYADKQAAVLALQKAQQAMMKNAEYRHPYYWSAFVLMGAAR